MIYTDAQSELSQWAGPLAPLASIGAASARSLRKMGYVPENLSSVVDADLILLTDALTEQFLDGAKEAIAEQILNAIDGVNLKSISVEEDAKTLRARWATMLNELRDWNRRAYGYGIAPPSPGSIDLGFASTGECW